MGIHVEDLTSSQSAMPVKFESLNPQIGEVELDAYTKKMSQNGLTREFILVTHKSLLRFLACNMGPGKLFQGCSLIAAPNSTESKPVWVCTIKSETLGKYSDVGEASAKSGDEIERNFASTIAQNRAKDRAIMFYLNLAPVGNGIGILSESEVSSAPTEIVRPSKSAGGEHECYTRQMAHTAFPVQHSQQSKPAKETTAPVEKTICEPKPSIEQEKVDNQKVPPQKNNKPAEDQTGLSTLSEKEIDKIINNPPASEEMEIWKKNKTIDVYHNGKEETIVSVVRRMEYGMNGSSESLKALNEYLSAEKDEMLLYYLASKKLLKHNNKGFFI